MATIQVFVYGYKSKELPEAVAALIENQSGQNQITVSVFDQTNVIREQKFNNAHYTHVYWDNRKSPFSYLENVLDNTDSDFFLYINGAIRFEKNWDLELVMGHGGRNVIISGNHTIRFSNSNHKFYPTYEKGVTDSAVITNWITNDFIFMRLNDFKRFPRLSGTLKNLGLEEIFSLFAMYSGFTVQCIATAWCSKIDQDIYSHDYHPFSLKHGYNKVIDLFHKKQNIFFGNLECVDMLSKSVGFDFIKLSHLPFMHDDVEYDPVMEMDSIGEERFISDVRMIR